MVATLKVFLSTGGTNGSPGTETDTTSLTPANIRFKTDDDPTIDAVSPIPIPGSGTKYSYAKSIYIKCTVAPSTSVNNFKVWADGSGFGTGITVVIGNSYPTRNSGSTAGYIKATGTVGDSGDELTTFYTGITAVADLFSYTSGSPLSISDANFISEAGNIINAINETTNYLILQAAIISSASPGTKTAELITIQYDEV